MNLKIWGMDLTVQEHPEEGYITVRSEGWMRIEAATVITVTAPQVLIDSPDITLGQVGGLVTVLGAIVGGGLGGLGGDGGGGGGGG